MDQEELVDEIVELAFHSEPVDPRPFVNERAVRAEIWDLIERYDNEREREEAELLTDHLEEAEAEIEKLQAELLLVRGGQ